MVPHDSKSDLPLDCAVVCITYTTAMGKMTVKAPRHVVENGNKESCAPWAFYVIGQVETLHLVLLHY